MAVNRESYVYRFGWRHGRTDAGQEEGDGPEGRTHGTARGQAVGRKGGRKGRRTTVQRFKRKGIEARLFNDVYGFRTSLNDSTSILIDD